ncbi:MAG: ABC transporter permease [Rhodospirillales bacterium]
MNLLTLSIAYIRDRALNTALNLLLLALGVATIVVLMLFSDQFTNRLTQDARGIHLVIGAKGSPLQLILSTIYHVDIPTGNISLKEAKMIAKHRLIKSAIPLALGDAHRGFRIVGTEHGYPAIYGAEVAEGRLWEKPFEVTLGARVAEKTGLKVGDTFIGAHGIAGTGAEHDDHPYHVVGVFKPTGAVIDRLIMTPVESVWIIHEIKEKAKAASPMDMMQAPEDREITALLVRYRSPIAAISLPRFINSRTGMQAASPGFEIKRLMALVGVGIDTLRGFGLLLIGTAALSMFIALYNAMQERRYDLVIMRSLGATRATLLRQVVLEGLIMAGAGTVLGIVLGHAVAGLLGQVLPQAKAMGLSGIVWLPEEWYLFLLAATVGVVATALPAAQAYRADIAVTLASR